MINRNPKIIPSSNSSIPNNKKERKSFNLLTLFKIILLIVVIVSVGYFFYYSSFFNVTSIEIEGSELVERRQLEELTYNYLDSNENNIWKFNGYGLRQTIEDQFPIIDQVIIQKGIPDTIRVVVYEREPKLIWVSDSQKYLVDQQGYAFINLDDYQEKKDHFQSSLIRIIDRSDLSVGSNQRLVSRDWVNFVLQLDKRLLNDFNLPAKKYYITETAFDLYVVSEIGEIIFDTNRPIGEQLSALRTTRESVSKKNFNYLDLRINGWVYYQ